MSNSWLIHHIHGNLSYEEVPDFDLTKESDFIKFDSPLKFDKFRIIGAMATGWTFRLEDMNPIPIEYANIDHIKTALNKGHSFVIKWGLVFVCQGKRNYAMRIIGNTFQIGEWNDVVRID